MSDLTIYKASAGSGKTYQLTRNYLELLFAKPSAYKNILAVTFTNKAAGEMKSRILESLWLLSRGEEKTSGYAGHLCDKFQLTGEQLRQRSYDILCKILNDYSSFYVGTIDRFFQWIIRGFMREIGLQTGYNLELNNDRVLHEAVDGIMFKMDEDDKLKEWLIMFAEDKLMEGKSWNFQKDIFDLGKEVFRESYQELYNEYSNDDDLREKVSNFRKDLISYISAFESMLKKMGEEAEKMVTDAGLSADDFKNKLKGPFGHFLKVQNKKGMDYYPGNRALNGVENTDEWVTKNQENKEFLTGIVESGLQPLLGKIINYYFDNCHEYFTARVLLKNIYTFGILNDISEQIRETIQDKNIFLLSDASMFLKKIIGDNEAPFVFEKAGNHFNHFMLDEFQDTSRFQWENFLPLIRNGLSEGAESIIVGDVKQSIYRWRNSDWKILAVELEGDLAPFSPSIEALDTNWRSYKNIVKFNNSFFSKAKALLKEMILEDLIDCSLEKDIIKTAWMELIDRVYSDANQDIPDKFLQKEGLVEHHFCRTANAEDYLSELKDRIPSLIMDLQDRGYKARDICILVRKGREGNEIASLLLEESIKSHDKYNFNVISNDSLYLNNNPAVQFLVSLLRFITNPEDRINTGFLRNEFLNYLLTDEDTSGDLHQIFSADDETDLKNLHVYFDKFIEKLKFLKRLPLYELIEELVLVFGLNRGQENLPYLQAFQDVVLEFIRSENSDISAFLSYWDTNGSNHTLNVSETQDAIRIMTIHKSKGLQFEVVIIPYCHWSMEPEIQGMKVNYIWCKTENSSFNSLPFMPVMYGKEMAESAFYKEFFTEKFHSYVDNLNLMYVAFTRAIRELHVFSQLEMNEVKNKRSGGFSYNIYSEKTTLPGSFHEIGPTEVFNKEKEFLSLGSRTIKEEPISEQESLFLEDYPVNLNREKLRLNVKNAYLSGLEDDFEVKLGYGTIMHEIFSYIRYADDVDFAVDKLKMKGKINKQEAGEIKSKIKRKLETDEFASWFSDKYYIRTENEMISENAELLRPDRVMISEDEVVVIDYKFGGKALKKHEDQLKKYSRTISSIESKKVKAFLWYFDLDELKEVI